MRHKPCNGSIPLVPPDRQFGACSSVESCILMHSCPSHQKRAISRGFCRKSSPVPVMLSFRWWIVSGWRDALTDGCSAWLYRTLCYSMVVSTMDGNRFFSAQRRTLTPSHTKRFQKREPSQTQQDSHHIERLGLKSHVTCIFVGGNRSC